MGTRGAIFRKNPDGTFDGVYHHWDSYIDGLGQSLHELYQREFRWKLSEMMHVLIDEHVAGWSTIVDATFKMEPGFVEFKQVKEPDKYCFDCNLPQEVNFYQSESCSKCGSNDLLNRPQCYCHGDREEKGDKRMHSVENAKQDIWLEYLYIIDPETSEMTIYDSHVKEEMTVNMDDDLDWDNICKFFVCDEDKEGEEEDE